ncbi:MAG: hypothetical protein COV44_02015 [Deltaproteobacteria bacterium CG11_big_fil_rev_8_21_14_0_20_45_16]|nr:MAG: hypothetical protein COV44_02015 [Deltaproteobacteria bacterium CG11_big_fil_rev_8_21_14_0_20_45_16]
MISCVLKFRSTPLKVNLLIGILLCSFEAFGVPPSDPLKQFVKGCAPKPEIESAADRFALSNQRARARLLGPELLKDRPAIFLMPADKQAKNLKRLIHHKVYGIASPGGFAMAEVHSLIEASVALYSQLLRMRALNRSVSGQILDSNLEDKLQLLLDSSVRILQTIDGELETKYTSRLDTPGPGINALLNSDPYFESVPSLLNRLSDPSNSK